MVFEHLGALDYSTRRLGIIALLLQIPALLVVIPLELSREPYQPFHSQLAKHASQVCLLALLATFVLALIGCFLDRRKGLSAFALAFPIGLFLLMSVGY
jgi:hypothetical protein